MPLRAFKPGEKFHWPGKGDVLIGKQDVNATHALLLPQQMPLPLALQKANGRWRVDASSIITVRKAGARLRQERKLQPQSP